jgi:hypothetical protein
VIVFQDEDAAVASGARESSPAGIVSGWAGAYLGLALALAGYVLDHVAMVAVGLALVMSGSWIGRAVARRATGIQGIEPGGSPSCGLSLR